MMFVSQIFIILAFVLLLSALMDGKYLKKNEEDPLKRVIEVSKMIILIISLNAKEIGEKFEKNNK